MLDIVLCGPLRSHPSTLIAVPGRLTQIRVRNLAPPTREMGRVSFLAVSTRSFVRFITPKDSSTDKFQSKDTPSTQQIASLGKVKNDEAIDKTPTKQLSSPLAQQSETRLRTSPWPDNHNLLRHRGLLRNMVVPSIIHTSVHHAKGHMGKGRANQCANEDIDGMMLSIPDLGESQQSSYQPR